MGQDREQADDCNNGRGPRQKAEPHAAPLADIELPEGQLILATQRSHDQWNTTFYSNNDRRRGVKDSWAIVFMNAEDMADRGLAEFARIGAESFSRDGRTRKATGYQAVAHKILCGLEEQSGQPLMKQVAVRVAKSVAESAG